MLRPEHIPEKAKEYIKKIIEPQNKKSTISDRHKQKQKLERASKLLGYDVIESRKLTLHFNNKDLKKNNKSTDEKYEYDLEKNDDYEEKNLEKIINKKQEQKETTQEYENKVKKESIKNNFNLTPQDIVTYFKRKGVIGEEKLILKIFLAGSNNMSFGVEGYSGSGKTFIVDKIIDLYNEKEIYRLDLSSKMAIFYDSKNVNNYNTIYIPELQKALQDKSSPIVEVVKNLTEGKDVTRIVTDNKKRGNRTFKINKGKAIIYTLASENYYKKDEELSRRFLRFKTNHTQEHLNNILGFKSTRRQDFLLNNNEEELNHALKNYFNSLRKLDIKIFDPYSTYISEFLPKTQKSIGYIDHYFSLVDAATRFHYNDRHKLENQDTQVIITDIEDHYLIHKIYHEEFLETLKGFSERNKFYDEVDIIEELQNKEIDWNKAQIIGHETIKQKLGINKKSYAEELKQKENQIKNKYAFLET